MKLQGDLSNLKELEKAYLAGLIDSRGAYRITRHNRDSVAYPFYEPLINVTFNDEEIFFWLRDRVSLGYVNHSNSKSRKGFTWNIYSAEAYTLLEIVEPYLNSKHLIRDIFKEMIRYKKENFVPGELNTTVMECLEEYATLLGLVNKGFHEENDRLYEYLIARQNIEGESYAKLRYKYLNVEDKEGLLKN